MATLLTDIVAPSSIVTLNGTQTLTNKTISGNSNTVILKNSATLGAEPLYSDISYGELVLNYTDGKLYFRNSSDTVDSFSVGGGAGGTASDSFRTIAVSGQSSIVADSSTDTLTVVGSGVISVLTNSTTDTLTITTSKSFPFVKYDGTSTTIPLRVADSALTNSLQNVYVPFVKYDGTSVTTLMLSV